MEKEDRIGEVDPNEFEEFSERIVDPEDSLEEKVVKLAQDVQHRMRYDNRSTNVELTDLYDFWRTGDCLQKAKVLEGLLRSQDIDADIDMGEKGHASVSIPHDQGNVLIDYYKEDEIGFRTNDFSWRVGKDGRVSVRERGEGEEVETLSPSHPVDRHLKEEFREELEGY